MAVIILQDELLWLQLVKSTLKLEENGQSMFDCLSAVIHRFLFRYKSRLDHLQSLPKIKTIPGVINITNNPSRYLTHS